MRLTDIDTLQRIASGQIDVLEDGEEILRALYAKDASDERQARAVEARIVKGALATPEGGKFLLWLARKTVFLPPTEAERSATTADAYAIAKARREGRDGIFAVIMEALSEKAQEEGNAEA